MWKTREVNPLSALESDTPALLHEPIAKIADNEETLLWEHLRAHQIRHEYIFCKSFAHINHSQCKDTLLSRVLQAGLKEKALLSIR